MIASTVALTIGKNGMINSQTTRVIGETVRDVPTLSAITNGDAGNNDDKSKLRYKDVNGADAKKPEEGFDPDDKVGANALTMRWTRSQTDLSGKAKRAPVARVQQVIRQYNADSMEYEDKENTEAISVETGHEDESLVMALFRSTYDEDNKSIVVQEVLCESQELKDIFNDIVGQRNMIPQDAASSKGPLRIRSPFVQFVWYWDEFQRACEPRDDDSENMALAREDLRKIMVLIQKSRLAPYFKVRDAMLAASAMPYEYLWTLYPPRTKVYARTFLDEVQMLEVTYCSLPTSLNGEYTDGKFVVSCDCFDWDGSRFRGVSHDITIVKDVGGSVQPTEQLITNRQVFPASFHGNKDRIRKELIERGRKFWQMSISDEYQYHHKGPLLAVKSSRSGIAQLLSRRQQNEIDAASSLSYGDSEGSTASRRDFQGKVIVDAYSFVRAQDEMSLSSLSTPLGDSEVQPLYDTECECRICENSVVLKWHRDHPSSSHIQKGEQESFADSEDRLMLCPPRVLGYALKGKFWAQFLINSCKDNESSDQARKEYFQAQLQLEKKYKLMLMAFISNHQATQGRHHSGNLSAKFKSLDIIEGKGNGLAILLHGPPGVGKTLTVETIALASGRPLLTVSVAEVGTDAARAEARLNFFFAMAARWRAIMLVDEADVFLEERIQTDNPNRNMLVSVLLRSLEYYEGIIFLTTNRIRSIDVAVQSRMHLAIQYKALSSKQKFEIYKNLLNKVPDENIKISREELYEQIQTNLCHSSSINGRQIRNIVSAALALASQRANDPFARHRPSSSKQKRRKRRDSYADEDEDEEESTDHEDEVDRDSRLTYNDLARIHRATEEFLSSLADMITRRSVLNEAGGPQSLQR